MPAWLAFLHSAEASLVLECPVQGAPLWRHLGARVEPGLLAPLAGSRTAASFSLDQDLPLSTAPPSGLGWFGPPVLLVRRGGKACPVAFGSAEVTQQDDAITIRLHDDLAGVLLEQRISLAPGGAFLFEARVENTGTIPLSIDWLARALLPLLASSSGLISWRGRHNAELVECAEPMPAQRWERGGRRGISGHGGPSGVVVPGEGATYHAGLVHALQLAWSGDSRISVERDDEGLWVLSAGAALAPGEVELAPGESYAAPQTILAVSAQGRNGASAQQHAAVRAMVAWPEGAMRPRPVHFNSWEACYFDHDEVRIGELAEAAAAIRIERFVLDDGWFKGRQDDTAGLGDWTCDPVKYPHGLKPIADKVRAPGMEFGLWVEPEMVNPDSDLYRTHPDWVLAEQGRARPTARNQLVLDLRRADVRDYLFGALDALLREVPIGYLKWDQNRDLAPAGGAAQVAGTYALLERLRNAHPAVEIEGCAGGGGRSDAGMARYVHRFWTSDNIDAVSRTSIQRGFLAWRPEQIAGAQIGLIQPGDAAPILPGLDLWDSWPLAHEDGRTARIAGREYWFFLSAPRFPDPGQRHDAARIRLASLGPDGWRDHGDALPHELSPGTREWAGSAVLHDDGTSVSLLFTAVGRKGQEHSFEQRLFAAAGTMSDDGPGEWQEPLELVRADGRRYVAAAEAEGRPGMIKAFRDPAWFRDPATGLRHILFPASAGWSDAE